MLFESVKARPLVSNSGRKVILVKFSCDEFICGVLFTVETINFVFL